MNHPWIRGFGLSILALTVGSSTYGSPGDKAKEARALLDDVAAAYKALPRYADHGEFVLGVDVDGTLSKTTVRASVALARPNKLRVDGGAASLSSDGTTLTSVVGPSKKYTAEPAPGSVGFATVAQSPVGSLLLGGPSGPACSMVLGLLLAENPAKAVLDLGEDLSIEGDQTLDGRDCRVLSVRTVNGTAYRLLIDPQSKLVRAVDVVPSTKELSDLFPADRKVSIATYRWTAGEISTEPGLADRFAAAVPKDFGKLGGPAAQADKSGPPKFDVQTLLDKPAPDFTLTLLDGDKTRTVARADLAGKVVVIDFWATWCGPCLAELPQVQKLIEGYAEAKADVVVVALSQDSDSKDPTEVRKLIEKTLDAKKIVLNRQPVGRVGLDPSNAVGEAFKVEGYPTVVILDGKGVVRSAHVGFSESVGRTLKAEVDALLAGKAVPKSETPADR